MVFVTAPRGARRRNPSVISASCVQGGGGGGGRAQSAITAIDSYYLLHDRFRRRRRLPLSGRLHILVTHYESDPDYSGADVSPTFLTR